jgi:hypothetical protein
LKNVLVITYYFPPSPGIGGVRPSGLARYLPDYGWNPLILTPMLPGEPGPEFRIIQTPDCDVIGQWKRRIGLNPKKSLNEEFHIERKKNRPSIADRLASIPFQIIAYPDDKKGWYEYAVRAGEKILKTEPIDAIISSSSPATCNLIAKTLSSKYHLPWIADFRDLWSENHYVTYSWIRKYFEKNLEIKTLKYASAITTVSQPLVDKLAALHKNKRIFLIRNGFDPGLLNSGTAVDDKFKIVYTGGLYEGKRDPDQLFCVIKKLSDSNLIRREDISIDFFGYPKSGFREDWLQEEIKRNCLEDIVTLHGEVSHDTAIAEQRKAQILLLLTWDNPEERGVYTGKLYEYLAARRPILSSGYKEGGVIQDLLDKTRAGVHPVSEMELQSVILQAYRQYKESGAVQYRGIEDEVLKFSHKEMAKKFAGVLDSVVR